MRIYTYGAYPCTYLVPLASCNFYSCRLCTNPPSLLYLGADVRNMERGWADVHIALGNIAGIPHLCWAHGASGEAPRKANHLDQPGPSTPLRVGASWQGSLYCAHDRIKCSDRSDFENPINSSHHGLQSSSDSSDEWKNMPLN